MGPRWVCNQSQPFITLPHSFLHKTEEKVQQLPALVAVVTLG